MQAGWRGAPSRPTAGEKPGRPVTARARARALDRGARDDRARRSAHSIRHRRRHRPGDLRLPAAAAPQHRQLRLLRRRVLLRLHPHHRLPAVQLRLRLRRSDFFWTWPVVFVGQLMVALCFAELAARYPISGAIFQWSSRLAGTDAGWFTGWVMVIGQVLTVATAAIALQAVLPAIWSGFQLVGGS